MRYIYRLNLKKSATLSISGKDYLKNVLVSSSFFEKISFCHDAIFICKRGPSVCLFVCLDIEPKLLEGSQPNFAWVILWYMWETSKYFFGLTSQSGGIVLEKLKNPDFPHMARDKGWNPFAARFALFLGGGDLDTF